MSHIFVLVDRKRVIAEFRSRHDATVHNASVDNVYELRVKCGNHGVQPVHAHEHCPVCYKEFFDKLYPRT